MTVAAPAESAVIVPVDLPAAARRLRDRLDPSAAQGVPAHITLLYPFAPPALLDEGVRVAVGRIVGSEAAFPFVLGAVGRWPNVIYLPPAPSDPFRRLIAALAAVFPDYPPYGGEHALDEIVPHVTIAQSERAADLDVAAAALPPLLPVRDFAREAAVIARLPGEPWRTFWRLPLATR
jgi:2'-5' RNA ligase